MEPAYGQTDVKGRRQRFARNCSLFKFQNMQGWLNSLFMELKLENCLKFVLKKFV